MWRKWRGKKKMLEKTTKMTKDMKEIDNKLREVEKKIEENKERKTKQLEKRNRKKEEWSKRNKMIKEDQNEMMRWLVKFIDENKYAWEKRRKSQENETLEEEKRGRN